MKNYQLNFFDKYFLRYDPKKLFFPIIKILFILKNKISLVINLSKLIFYFDLMI